jgi:uncharacterized protein RhaS with RHS repeats
MYDEESKLYYLNARYYDSKNGRFMTRDPKFNDNLYFYADNNPVSLVDPTGKWAEKLPGFIWNPNGKGTVGFQVNTTPDFLSKSYCLRYAYDILKMRGKRSWGILKYAGYNAVQMAAEFYTHALLFYTSKITIPLTGHGKGWRDSGKIINIDPGDSRAGWFMTIWILF